MDSISNQNYTQSIPSGYLFPKFCLHRIFDRSHSSKSIPTKNHMLPIKIPPSVNCHRILFTNHFFVIIFKKIMHNINRCTVLILETWIQLCLKNISSLPSNWFVLRTAKTQFCSAVLSCIVEQNKDISFHKTKRSFLSACQCQHIIDVWI